MNTTVTHPGEALLDRGKDRVEGAQMSDTGRAWFAVRTQPRYEKKVERQLRERGITSFLPLVRELRRWSDRHKGIDAPMFPCYLFVRIALAGQSRTTVLGVPGVAGFVGPRRGALAVPPQEIEALQRLVASGLDCTPDPFVATGRRVRMLGGCLDGMEGLVVRHHGDDRFVIAVSGIERAVAVRIQGYDFELIRDRTDAGVNETAHGV